MPESPFKTRVLRRAGGPGDLTRLWRELRSSRRLALWELDLPDAPPTACGSYGALLEWLVELQARRQGKAAADHWIDHTPTNLRHAALLTELFPSARFVHLVRDGRAVAASILPLDWGPSTIDAAAHHWLESLAFGLGAESWAGPGRILRVRYEDLVAQPQAELERLCAFLDLQWEPSLVRGGGFAPPAYTLGQHRRVLGPPEPGRIGAWQAELSPRAIEVFESIAGELLTYLGYTPLHGAQARPLSTVERLRLRLERLRRRVTDRWRLRLRRRKIPGGEG